ncbi:MAG: hypothetical protein Q8941_22615 [Bacteroidota bacterium]|nr:hypothetical protein [Bacteroidota bacterium]
MLLEDIYAEINTLQLQIAELEKDFDIALQDYSRLGYARQIYHNIKAIEGRVYQLRILLDQK